MTLKAISITAILVFFGLTAKSIQANTTHSLFYKKNKLDSTKLDAFITLSWRLQNSSIHFTKNENGLLSAEIICLLRLSNDSAIIKEETFVIKTPEKKSSTEAYYQIIADQYEYTVSPGHYEIELVLYEQEYKNELFQFTDTLNIPNRLNNDPFLSSIMLLDTLFTTKTATIYTKNGMINLPLTTSFLGEKKDTLHCYFENYLANKYPLAAQPLVITSSISWKPNESPIPGYMAKDTLDSKKTLEGFYQHFAIQNLKSGNYYVSTVLVDNYGTILDKKVVFFQRYNTRPDSLIKTIKETDTVKDELKNSAHILDLTNTFVGKYTPNQVRAILKMLLLISDQNEGASINGFLRKPDELYSKYFIYNFWEQRDKQNPEKAWKAFAERIKEVNRLFKGSGQSGYETDRGRIYIQYGKPNDRIIVNSENSALPYEIWQYYSTEKQGREGVFLFYKPGRALGDYQLLHSTVIGEKRNTNWRSLLYNNSITGSGNLGNDSQAEQYLRNK